MRFVPGQAYARQDLHARFGGQEQGGISTPRKHPEVLIFTGETGKQYGYEDGFQPDGTFWYTGEGQVGDMRMIRGNKAIRDHQANDRPLHLFRILPDGPVEYMGEAFYLDHHRRPAPDRNGDARMAIVFSLEVQSGGSGVAGSPTTTPRVSNGGSLWSQPLETVRAAAIEAPPPSASRTQRAVSTRQRSKAVRVYVLRRSKGICEGCGQPAPFETPKGRPYLEPHHIRRLADGGPDHPRWVAALCPNCHRRVHHGSDGREFNEEVSARLAELEC